MIAGATLSPASLRAFPRAPPPTGRPDRPARTRAARLAGVTTLADSTAAPAAAEPVQPVSRAARARAVVGAYIALTKPRIIELLLVTTVPTMVLAERGLPSWTLVLATLVGGSLAAGSANALNCWYDRDIDSVMKRTQRRSLVRHTASDRGALVFGLVLGVLATAWLAVTTNVLSAVLADAAIAFYVLVYTMVLKRRTSQNIVWGGAAGCMPVLIGWSAVTNTVSWEALVLFLVIFFWTPPHFWALAMRYRDDYAAAGVPMLPVVATPERVAVRITAYSWAMVATSGLLAWPLGSSGAVYAVSALVLGAVFLSEAHRLQARVRAGVEVAPMRLFHWSITYLALLFLAVAVDQLV
jgi:protoheme IX farnesyltransferase